MHKYRIRFDRGPDEVFDAVSEAAARDYVRTILLDEGAEEGDGGGLYLIDEGGRDDEEYLGEVCLGDDDGPEPGECLTLWGSGSGWDQ